MSYKTLAPRPASGSRPSEPTTPPHLKKKPAPKIACEACRTRKTACDAKRPSCTKCTRKLLPCRYNSSGERLRQRVQDLQSSLDSHRELVNLLSSTPEENIIQVLRDLKAAPEPLAYLASARGDADVVMRERRPSTDASVAGSLHSQSRVELEFDEVTARYEIAYPALPPIPLATVNPRPRFAVSASASGLDQPLLNFGGPGSSSPTSFFQTQPESTHPLSNLTAVLAARLRSAGPGTTPTYIDERLRHVQIDYWTSVPISNNFAATVISSYLEVDHPYYGFFDADLFLHDLVNREMTFCSPFLVSSLLSQACYTSSAIDSRALALGHAFFQEAEMLYKAERMSELLPNSSALAVFSMLCTLQCREDLAFETQQLGRKMGERMKLFGVANEGPNRTHFHNMSPKMKIASAQVAWGLYSWLSLRTLLYEDKAINYPPILPIPGGLPEDGREWSLGLEWPPHSPPSWMGCAFPALCTLWVLAQEIAAVYFINQEEPLIERVSLAFAESKYHKLLEWAATLKPELKRREQNTPTDTLIFHMYLHTIILTLFRPFLQGPQRDQKLRVFTSADSSPGAIYEASIIQMKHIVLQHHLDYPGKPFSNFACAGYIQLCSTIAGELGPSATANTRNSTTKSERRENRFYFDLWPSLGLASRKKGAAFPTAVQPMQAQVIVNFDLAVVDVGAARAQVLASKLEDLVLFDEFTIDTTTTSDEDGEEDGSYETTNAIEINEHENDYESSAQSGGSVIGSDHYWTPTSDVCREIDNCWMGGCDGS
ncbi:uncharacterized protein PG998_005977 [Apiospora kogelbergensis]|uniref:uncharacterized protein n=1 Tax=Apiospora kogelbergensis TaxID=1337665 RepID=UPI00312F18C4